MTRDLALLVAGAVITPLALLLWRGVTTAQRRVRRSRRIARDQRLAPAAVEWFRMNGFLDNLFLPGLVNQGRPISIVHDLDATMAGVVEPGAETFVVMGAPERRQFAVEQAAVRRRQKAGATLWDGTLLYAADLRPGPGGSSRITAGACNFYSYVTVSDRIQTALLDPDKPRHQALLEHNLSSVSAVAGADYEPVCLAAATTCVFETDTGPQLLLTERAEEVVNALGTYCVIPTFGLESPIVDGVRSEYGTVFYNFAKEFLEEVYGQEELIRAATSESLDPDAIFESNQARSLLDQFDAGAAELRVMGMGVEVTDGTLTLALLAHFRSPDFYREVRRRANAGWEVKRADGKRPISFLAPDSDELAAACTAERMSATSLFSVDLALSHLAGLP